MSEKRYFTMALPLSETAQAMVSQKAGQYQLRAMLWSVAAERLKGPCWARPVPCSPRR